MSHTPPSDHPTSSLAGRTIQPRFGQLEQGCRQLLMSHLDQQLTLAFEQSDDALFAQANQATSNLEQALFFDSMRAVRECQVGITRHFHQRLANDFAAFLDGRHETPATPAVTNQPLSLIGHEEHEEQLILDDMSKRAQERCAPQLNALARRLAKLQRAMPPQQPQDIPCSPTTIADAFRRALPQESLPLRIRRTLYERFEQQVMGSLPQLYAALNQRLVDAGVLPQLGEQTPQPAPTASRPPRPAAAERLRPDAGRPNAASGNATQLFHGVTQLLNRRHRNGNPATPENAPQLPASAGSAQPPLPPVVGTYSESELMSALTRLQQISARDLAAPLQRPQQAAQLKRRLHAELEAACALPARQQLSETDADIIDLVGMLFAFILDDPALPDRCKTVLSHLHTPYLKLALRDRQLFTHEEHPARRLLDSMAKAGARYAEDSDSSGLLAKMQAIVERILQDFSNDAALFPALLQEFEDHLRRLQQRTELRERRTLEAARGRDRLHAARRQADEQIRRVRIGRTLPHLVEELLEQGWRDVLALIHLRLGEQSDEWRRACLTAEQLAWSCTLLDHHGRARLQRERLALLEQLRGGLQQLGSLAEDDIRRLLQDVVTCQHAVQAQQPELAARLSAKLPDGPLGAMLQEQTAEEPRADAALPAALESQLRRVQALPFGSLFGFQEDGHLRRLRLSWFSPATGHYLFIDPSGEHSRSWPATRLAQALQDGSVRLLGEPNDTPLMERALQAIYRVLQRLEDSNGAD